MRIRPRGVLAPALLMGLLLAGPGADAKQTSFARQVEKGAIAYSYRFTDAEGREQALRFQLAPPGRTEPTYALVVIDEAFDKADHTFTQAGLEVFRSFGFQLLLATPMKMLQTIDDYVGGVVMVTNEAGRGSTLQELHYDTVGAALLDTLAAGLGDAFTPDVHAAWAEVYGFIAATMQRAAAETPLAA